MHRCIADKRGFTLIELLVIVIIVGALTSMAIIQMNSSRYRAFVASMETDLRNVAAAQEVYYESTLTLGSATYSDRPNQLRVTLSPGVSIRMLANSTGWSAEASHSSLPVGRRCSIYTGTMSQRAPATQPGIIACN